MPGSVEDGHRVIRATYCNWRPVPSRSVIQIIFELPIEQTEDVLRKLGVPAVPGETKWVAIARLDELVAAETQRQEEARARVVRGKAKREERDPNMDKARIRAVLLARDPVFRRWAGARDEEDAATIIRERCCGGFSRSLIGTDPNIYQAFLHMEAEFNEEVGRQATNG